MPIPFLELVTESQVTDTLSSSSSQRLVILQHLEVDVMAAALPHNTFPDTVTNTRQVGQTHQSVVHQERVLIGRLYQGDTGPARVHRTGGDVLLTSHHRVIFLTTAAK